MSQPTVLSVNVSEIQEFERNARAWRSAIFKEPVSGPVPVHSLGLQGDAQASTKSHGGPYRALYAYPHQHYAHWAQHADLHDWPLGGFGENLTIIHLDEDNTHMGDTLRLGTVLAQITQPRGPCATLAMRVDNPHFPKLMSESGRTGFYMRVLEEGHIAAGDTIEIVDRDPRALTVRRCYRLRYFDKDNHEAMRTAAEIEAIEPSWRVWFAERANA